LRGKMVGRWGKKGEEVRELRVLARIFIFYLS
jgi:hypothetical protein